MPKDKIKVLIIDDSAFMRGALRSIIKKHNQFELLGVAKDGLEGVQRAKELQPDVITLDVEMPRMDGLTALKPIKQVCDAAVLMVSSLTTESSQAALTAMRNGASDVIAKENPDRLGGGSTMEAELVGKLMAIVGTQRERKSWKERVADRLKRKAVDREEGKTSRFRKPGVLQSKREDRSKAPASRAPQGKETSRLSAPARNWGDVSESVSKRPLNLRASDYDILVIGSSTGGPPVLEKIFSALPSSLPMPVVVAQHMPVLFTKSMSERLSRICALSVTHIDEGMTIKRGEAYIAPGGTHCHLKKVGKDYKAHLSNEPKTDLYKPSVNVLFETATQISGARVLGIMLTGMGEDGLRGSRELVRRGGKVIAQNAETSVVYGMPRAVTEADLIIASLSPEDIGATLKNLV